MALIKRGKLVTDDFVDATALETLPPKGKIIVSVSQWRAERAQLVGRKIGLRLKSDEPPELIAEDVNLFSVIALEFPVFRDGRAYSYARILREQLAFTGELRAVGDVLMEQVHFMLRVGFDSFELSSTDALGDYEAALADFSVWYQPTGDGHATAIQLRAARSS